LSFDCSDLGDSNAEFPGSTKGKPAWKRRTEIPKLSMMQRYSLERRLGVHTLKICFFVTPGHVRGRVRWQRNNNQAAWFTSATDYYGNFA
jgi:hypothetical protein